MRLILPVLMILLGTVAAIGPLDLAMLARVNHFWPVSLIAVGLEEIYLWARSGHNQ